MSKRDDSASQETSPRDAAIKKAGVAVGIGSAAIAAALIYANRRKQGRKDKD